MPYNGSGTFNRVHDWTDDDNADIDITASRMDAEDDGFATGLSTCVTKDGQTTVTANLPMATNRHTGVGNAVDRTDYSAAGQIQDGGLIYAADTGTANTYAISLSPAITAYAAGQVFLFKASNTNTGASTLNVNTVGAKNIFTHEGNAVVAGDIEADGLYLAAYDGTQFQLINAKDRPDTRGLITGATTFDGYGVSSVANSAVGFNEITFDNAASATLKQVVVVTQSSSFPLVIGTNYTGASGVTTRTIDDTGTNTNSYPKAIVRWLIT